MTRTSPRLAVHCRAVTDREPFVKLSRLGAGVAAAGWIGIASSVGAPLALAVSGGGGISAPLSGMDFTGQDLRNNSYTKAVLRQTNFTDCNLECLCNF